MPAEPAAPSRFLVAQSFDAARACAEIDLGWRRLDPRRFTDTEGQTVQYLGLARALPFVRRGGEIILGYAWYLNPEWRGLRDYAAARAIILTDYLKLKKAST